jgi:hypothetical protein
VPDPRRDPQHQPGDDDAVVLPFPRQPHEPAQSSTKEGRWRVERIDTEPMTAQQYDRAVTTLATLITQWQRNQENVNEPHEEAA